MTCCALLAVALVVVAAPVAQADLSRRDPSDVPIRLDIQRSSSLVFRSSDPERIGMTIEFYQRIPRRLEPKVNVWYDAYSTPQADFLMRYRYSSGGIIVGCELVRLSDRHRIDAGDVDEGPRSLYCESRRPGAMGEHGSVRWRVGAVLPGRGRDVAPNVGWYRHT
jgi:hypothetical protein